MIRMWLTELVRIVLGVLLMFLISFSLFLYYSLSSLGGRESESIERGEFGHRVTPESKIKYKEYLDANILTLS